MQTKSILKKFFVWLGFAHCQGTKSCFSSLASAKSAKSYGHKRGMAMLEALPIIWIMFVLMGATLGSWGVVHTAILRSISARHYIFFLFNNRSDLAYLRDFSQYGLEEKTKKVYYRKDESIGLDYRYSYIQSEKMPQSGPEGKQYATARRVDFRNLNYSGETTDFLSEPKGHLNIEAEVQPTGMNRKKVKKVWIMVRYGICLSASCGGP